MEQKIKDMTQPSGSRKPEIKEGQEKVKAAHLSSNPINGKLESNNGTAHFEVEVHKAFFRIFFGI